MRDFPGVRLSFGTGGFGEKLQISLAGDDPSPLDNLSLSQDMQRLARCLDGLEADKRDMVLLAYRQGLSREELAERYARPVPTIKTWLRRSLAQLRDCLGT